MGMIPYFLHMARTRNVLGPFAFGRLCVQSKIGRALERRYLGRVLLGGCFCKVKVVRVTTNPGTADGWHGSICCLAFQFC